jgi:hypothetical protein
MFPPVYCLGRLNAARVYELQATGRYMVVALQRRFKTQSAPTSLYTCLKCLFLLLNVVLLRALAMMFTSLSCLWPVHKEIVVYLDSMKTTLRTSAETDFFFS